MNIGIIGSEAAKFTPETESIAKLKITGILASADMVTVVSGHCHLGGIDIWAEEAAIASGLPTLIYPPKTHSWEGGYKPRNILIAQNSDKIYVITLKELPESYSGMRFKGCYHCDARINRAVKEDGADGMSDLCHAIPKTRGFAQSHVKSGACYTAWYAVEKFNKEAEWIVI